MKLFNRVRVNTAPGTVNTSDRIELFSPPIEIDPPAKFIPSKKDRHKAGYMAEYMRKRRAKK